MSREDFVYALLLILSLIFSYFVKLILNPNLKRAFVCFCGIFTAVLTCGLAFFHSFITIIVNLFIIRFFSAKYIHIMSFVWCFSYLTFFRICQNFGFSPPVNYLNAIQLITTLKMVGLAFEMRDYYKEEALKSEQKHEQSRIINYIKTNYNTNDYNLLDNNYNVKRMYRFNTDNMDNNYNIRDNYNLRELNYNLRQGGDSNVMPDFNYNAFKDFVGPLYKDATFLRLFTYSYCFIGLMTGPYYTYKTYDDMVTNGNSKHLNCNKHLLASLKYLPICIPVFLSISQLYSLETVRSASFPSKPILTRLSYMVILFALFRARLYIAWLLSDMVCTLACLGIYPISSQPRCGAGPTNLAAYSDWLQKSNNEKLESEYNFETIKNLNIYGCELAPTIRQGMKSWNMSVQYWLAAYVYKRFPIRIGIIRVTTTMLVSAYWHGIHPGYYLSFLLMPFYLACEDLILNCFTNSRWAKSVHSSERFKKLCWLVKMRLFEYTSMGFLLLNYQDTLNYWGSIGFSGHLFIPICLAVGTLWKALQFLTKCKRGGSVNTGGGSISGNNDRNIGVRGY